MWPRRRVRRLGAGGSSSSEMTSRSRSPPWRATPPRVPERSAGFCGLGLGCLLHGRLVLAHLAQGLAVDDVGDGLERAGDAVVARLLLPAGRAHAELLGKEGDEDARLLLAEAGQALDVGVELLTCARRPPDL